MSKRSQVPPPRSLARPQETNSGHRDPPNVLPRRLRGRIHRHAACGQVGAHRSRPNDLAAALPSRVPHCHDWRRRLIFRSRVRPSGRRRINQHRERSWSRHLACPTPAPGLPYEPPPNSTARSSLARLSRTLVLKRHDPLDGADVVLLPHDERRRVRRGSDRWSIATLIDLADGRSISAASDWNAQTTHWVLCRIEALDPDEVHPEDREFRLVDDDAEIPAYGTSLALLLEAALDSGGDIAHLRNGSLHQLEAAHA